VQSSENDEAAQRASSIVLETYENTFAFGNRSAGALHLAWYYRALSLEAEYQRGRVQFTRTEDGVTVNPTVPINGYHVTTGLFLTGETVERRTTVKPLHPWDPLHRRWGYGAVELFARYSQLHLGEEIFTEGLADPDRWTNLAHMTDIGWNWYMNEYVKWYFDWQHVNYGSPVLLNEGKDLYGRHNDLFWVRCQLYF
jgi:phosphate-selective porin OprO/OprP